MVSVEPIVGAPKTRAEFYARKNGGNYATARSEFKCEQSLCLNIITPGVVYFNTKEVTTWPKTKRICACCAEGPCQ